MTRRRKRQGPARILAPAMIVIALIAIIALRPAARTPALPVAPPPPPPGQDGRIVYPAAAVRLLTLPDGEQKRIRSLLNVTAPMRFGDYVWNDKDVPDGPVWMRIDLAHQTLSVFRDGNEIGTAVILYGTDGHPTPTGLFHVKEMAAEHQSNLYDAAMPYMLRLTDDGVAIHASSVRKGSATHGCIGVPIDFARKLFAVVHRGDMVAILPAKDAPKAA